MRSILPPGGKLENVLGWIGAAYLGVLTVIAIVGGIAFAVWLILQLL